MRPALLLLAALTSLTPAALAAEPKPKKHALLVGVKKYNHNSLSDLSYTENDVEELAALLSKPGAGFGLVRVLTTSRGGKDDTEARKWYRKAAAQGNEAAKKALERLAGGAKPGPKPPAKPKLPARPQLKG